jgi:hypothetical protein
MRGLASALALLMLVSAVSAGTGEGKTMTIIDFSQSDAVWPEINDGVMGGLSSSRMTSGDGHAIFAGVVSFENNGGFASVRSRPVVHDLSAFGGLVLRVRGDGKRYSFRLKTDASFDGVSYQVEINPPPGEWAELAIPFGDFVPVYRGRIVRDHPPLDPSRIATFGFLISRQEGPFRLDIEAIRTLPPLDRS